MMPSQGRLATHAISKMYRGRPVVQDVSLHVHRGEIVGLLGPNGAGKTTTFYMIVGLIRPNAGTISLDNQCLTRLPMHQRARLGIGYLPQEPSIFRKLTVEQNIQAILEIVPFSRAEQRRKIEVLLEDFALTKIRHVQGYALSGGERRRVELARLLATAPQFVLLDEPFTGIDPIMVGELQTFIFHLKQQGIGILITDHRVRETLEITERAYIMHAGRILQSGSPQELVESPEVKEIYLGKGFSFYSEGNQTV
jgi:lipopolysaccharide export system ATP-binding protein